MNLVNSVDKLIEACEAPRTIRMPRTVQLVKQLRKELNFSDIVKNMRRKGEGDTKREFTLQAYTMFEWWNAGNQEVFIIQNSRANASL